ncbi:hypothetical protein, partial [Escherichia coli]|uniref:hypothetical protein n=1 Tax=Escherichia coli TaxID=562 RepID=UPI0032DBB69D
GIKCEEFLKLKQDGASVQEYYTKYVELLRFAQDIVPDDVSKARRFVRGMDWDNRRALAPFMCSTLKEAYERASTIIKCTWISRRCTSETRERPRRSRGNRNLKIRNQTLEKPVAGKEKERGK